MKLWDKLVRWWMGEAVKWPEYPEKPFDLNVGDRVTLIDRSAQIPQGSVGTIVASWESSFKIGWHVVFDAPVKPGRKSDGAWAIEDVRLRPVLNDD